MNKHNHKRVAIAAIFAGVVLAAVAINQGAEGGRDAPVLAEIPSNLESTPGDGEVIRAYSVSGMCCESCTRKLHDKVLGMDGIEACAVDLDEERVVLIAKGGVASEQILTTLNFGKYRAVEVPAGS
jgi:copper chaperone CopZ